MARLYTLIVRQIPWVIGQTDLYNYFSKFGTVYRAQIVFDKDTGISKNYGYVVYDNSNTVAEVLNSKHLLVNQEVHVTKHKENKNILPRRSINKYNVEDTLTTY